MQRDLRPGAPGVRLQPARTFSVEQPSNPACSFPPRVNPLLDDPIMPANVVIVPVATAIFVVSLLDLMLLNGAGLWYHQNRSQSK